MGCRHPPHVMLNSSDCSLEDTLSVDGSTDTVVLLDVDVGHDMDTLDVFAILHHECILPIAQHAERQLWH